MCQILPHASSSPIPHAPCLMALQQPVMNSLVLCVILLSALGAQASEPFIGEIRYFGYTFCPRGWANADGQLMAISSNSALFSLLGTTYGGDGRTTFGLPDLRGRSPLHVGNGPGLTPRSLGEKSGEETVTLTTTQIPSHSHTLMASTDGATTSEPGGKLLSEGMPVMLCVFMVFLFHKHAQCCGFSCCLIPQSFLWRFWRNALRKNGFRKRKSQK